MAEAAQAEQRHEQGGDRVTVAAPTHGLAVTRLRLADFRSYESLDLAFDGRPVVLAGENGSGKTNLLEAVSLLSPGRGLRGAAYADLARADGAGGWAVAAWISLHGAEHRLGTGIEAAAAESTGRSRQVRVDGEAQASSGVLGEWVRMVWLTPAMDRLFVEGASGRRKFLDRLVMAFDPSHGTRANAYERCLRERNRLLTAESPDTAWLSGIEAQLAEHGVAIAAARRATVARLAGTIAAKANDGAFPHAELSLDGEVETALATMPAVDVEDWLTTEFAATRGRDAAAGRTLTGTHRSDLQVRHVEKDREARLCSTGEQKALLIGLVLAQARLLAGEGTPPVLLLDEIAAHLDAQRRAALFDDLVAMELQAFLTGTDANLFETLGPRAQHFRLSAGRLVEAL